jgi:hypothetical protein
LGALFITTIIYNHSMRKQIFLLIFAPALLFPLAAFFIALRNPSIFPFFPDPPISIIFFFILAIGLLFFFLKRGNLLQENIQGLILFAFFTMGYFILSALFNRVDLNTNNVYFEADNWSWLRRMSLEDGWNVGTRAAHPFVHLIFRPLAWILSIFTLGDRYEANLLLLSLSGGGCVFLAWKIVRHISMDETYAVSFASLLGLSASHLIFATVIETYIFSALCLLLFIWLLLREKPAFLLITAGSLAFGITITNIIQQGITTLLVQRNLKRTVILFGLVVLIGIGLNIISRVLYPVTEYVFLPQNLAGEEKFQKQPTWQRTELIVEDLLIYNIAAPQPYVDTRNQTLRFNFLAGTIREYIWFGWPSLILWIGTIGLALFYFPRNLHLDTTNRRLALSMLACLIFNFVLHMGYGAEPFLYSAGWTYSLVLFTAINLTSLAERSWFKLILLLLVSSVLVNNLWFLYLVARKTSESFG